MNSSIKAIQTVRRVPVMELTVAVKRANSQRQLHGPSDASGRRSRDIHARRNQRLESIRNSKRLEY